MTAADRDRVKLLHGPYRSPPCRVGKKLFCEVRGTVKVVRFSAGRVPWPMTPGRKHGGRATLIVCGDLVKAIRRESALALRYWFGICGSFVWKLRKALGVPRINAGTRRLFREHVAPALLKANLGRPLTIEHRRTFSEVRRRLKMRPPKAGRPWTRAEDRLLGRMLDREVAARTGRTASAVGARRQLLRIPCASGSGKRILRARCGGERRRRVGLARSEKSSVAVRHGQRSRI